MSLFDFYPLEALGYVRMGLTVFMLLAFALIVFSLKSLRAFHKSAGAISAGGQTAGEAALTVNASGTRYDAEYRVFSSVVIFVLLAFPLLYTVMYL